MKESIKLFRLFFVVAFTVLFVCSPDSYTHDLFDRMDSAWFFMCGKAWMNGMIPYVDFTDSKGPLLWLVYGIGYLISPHNYIGVFWLSVILYTGIFICIYKIAEIFLKERWQQFTVVIIMISSYFTFFFHYEILSEDWNSGFVALAFYRIIFLLYTDKGKETHSVYITCFLLGICLTGSLLVKFSTTVMLGITYFYVLYVLIREKRNIIFSFLSLIGGCSVLLVPMAIYMLAVGAYSSFVQEYFFNTVQTVSSSNSLATYFREWLIMTYEARYVMLFGISIIGALLMSRRVSKDKWFFLFSFVAFYAIAIHNTSPKHCHYLAICLFFPLWFVIGLLSEPALQSKRLWKNFAVVTCGFTLVANLFHWGYLVPNFFLHPNTKPRESYYHVASIMSQVKSPRVICYKTRELGLGVPAGSLPATKYWAEQLGASEEMLQSQEEAVRSGKADFIIMEESILQDCDSMINASGYHYVCDYEYGGVVYMIYSKHQLQKPPKSCCVSSLDVLLKKKVIQ